MVLFLFLIGDTGFAMNVQHSLMIGLLPIILVVIINKIFNYVKMPWRGGGGHHGGGRGVWRGGGKWYTKPS